MKIESFKDQVIHFIGIGGIGMSGIAEILHNLGYKVQGSDCSEGSNTLRLKQQGIPVFIGHHSSHIKGSALVVVSTSIQSDNAELKEARSQKIPVIHRAEMLAELMRLKSTIVVAGSHGKTTTTSLIGCLLEAASLDPTVVNGGIINSYGTNTRQGKGDWMVVEGDESDSSFTKLPTTLAVITNINAEHLNHYHSFEGLYQAFYQFIHNVPFYGMVMACIDHPGVKQLISSITDRFIVSYGFHEEADIRGYNVRHEQNGIVFDVCFSKRAQHYLALKGVNKSVQFQNVFLPMVGEHNVVNALAAIGIAYQLDISLETIALGLKNFKGVKRRFTKTAEVNGVTFIDDYGHHPVEINAVLNAARGICPDRKVIAVVQPHRYTRLHSLMEEFTSCFSKADHLILAPVYSAGEEAIIGVNHIVLADKIRLSGKKEVTVIEEAEELERLLPSLVQPGDYVIFLGAGTITEWAHLIPKKLVKTALAS
jgi:UDP-N-acetylmuramate--alanine ligase